MSQDAALKTLNYLLSTPRAPAQVKSTASGVESEISSLSLRVLMEKYGIPTRPYALPPVL
jgi:hypothetical protein